jgi:hypothetical protein
MRSRAKIAIVGRTVINELFGDTDPIGQIKIRGITFTVVGAWKRRGRPRSRIAITRLCPPDDRPAPLSASRISAR